MNIRMNISRMLILRMNIWGMLMLGGNVGMLGVNVLIGATSVVNVRSECGNRGMLGMNALIGAI